MTLAKNASLVPGIKKPRGGPRPNSGRPLGKTTKNSWAEVLREFELQAGRTFPEQLVYNYMQALATGDGHLIYRYDHAIFNKLAPDLHHVELETNQLEERQREFAAAIAHLNLVTTRQE